MTIKIEHTVYTLTEGNLSFQVTKQDGLGFEHMSVHDYGEACSGIMKRWGAPREIVKALRTIANAVEKEFVNNKPKELR